MKNSKETKRQIKEKLEHLYIFVFGVFIGKYPNETLFVSILVLIVLIIILFVMFFIRQIDKFMDNKYGGENEKHTN